MVMINKKAILFIIIIALYLNISGCIDFGDAGISEYNKFLGKWSNEEITIIFDNSRNIKWVDNNTYRYNLPYKGCILSCNPYKLKIYNPNNESDNVLFDYEFSSDNKRLILNKNILLHKQ